MSPTRSLFAAALSTLLFSGCIPYAVGTTAETLSPGEVTESSSVYFIPGGIESLAPADSVRTTSYSAVDLEARLGLTENADIGIRIPGASGVVVNYKRRLTPSDQASAVALMGGIGIVNLGDHAHGELTLLVSNGQHPHLTPYGGLRAMQVVPITPEAVRDSPTLGGFLGVRIGRNEMAVTPELAIYYDRSALDLRDSSVILVPSFTLHGDQLIRALFGWR